MRTLTQNQSAQCLPLLPVLSGDYRPKVQAESVLMLGGGAEGGQVAVGLPGRGRVVGTADRDGERVKPSRPVAQLMTGELRPRVREHRATAGRRVRDYPVEVVDAGVDGLVVAAAKPDADG